MSRARDFSDQAILDTLDLLDSNAGNVKRTSRETGVSESTVRRWRNERDEWQAEKHQAAQEGRPPVPASRVASLLRDRELGDALVPSLLGASAAGGPGLAPEKKGVEPLVDRLLRTLETTTDAADRIVSALLEANLPPSALLSLLEILVRRETILAERLVNLQAAQRDTAGASVLQLTLNMLHQSGPASA